jgi:hypothetical protein
MGLLDIWNEWKRNNQYSSTGFEDYTSTPGGTMNVTGQGDGFSTMLNRKDKPDQIFKDKKLGNQIVQGGSAADIAGEAAMFDDKGNYGQTNTGFVRIKDTDGKVKLLPANNKKVKQAGSDFVLTKQEAGKTPNLAKDNMPSDPIVMGGSGTQQGDISFMQKLANMANVDFDKAMASWKDKGGFEGLMANPAFTMGLAFMQAGAEGKTLGAGALDNTLKAAGISQHYKSIIEARKMEPIQATTADIAEVKDMLKSINIEEGNWLENLISGPGAGAKYEAAVEEIAVQFQKEIREKQNDLKRQGKSQIIRRTDQLKILERLVNSKIVRKKESFLSKLGITSGTLQKDIPGLARGGTAQAGKAYVVGEEGPEIIIPKSDGNVLTNDDSQIYAMLLAANPQLQKVSRQRAEKILRNRFPEYFEG